MNNNNEFFGDFDDLFNALNGNNNNAANNNMNENNPRMQWVEEMETVTVVVKVY